MHDTVIWVSGYWGWAIGALWFVHAVCIGRWITINMTAEENYGPADNLVASLPGMFMGIIGATAIFLGLAWLLSFTGVEIGFR